MSSHAERSLIDNLCISLGISLDFAVVTGCLKIAKESIFTGTNNFVSDTILSPRLSESFGFTQADVDQMLKDAGLESQSAEIKTWYDGYHFGDADIYCPWDVISYLRDFQYGVAQKPKSYWKNTSDNAIIRSFIDYAGDNITTKLETLMAGGSIVQHIEENLTYDYLHSSEENLWSVLYLTGYLTKVCYSVRKRASRSRSWLMNPVSPSRCDPISSTPSTSMVLLFWTKLWLEER